MGTVAVVIPVKPLAEAKTRLGLAGVQRRAVMATLLAQTVNAASACPEVIEIVVVTADPDVADLVSWLGATPVAEPGPRGINPALETGRSWVRDNRSCSAIALMVGDLAALHSDDLSAVVAEFFGHRRPLLVEDWSGSGTTCLVHAARDQPPLAFGPSSAARHASLGYLRARGSLSSLRRDVDTLGDLRALVGAHAVTPNNHEPVEPVTLLEKW